MKRLCGTWLLGTLVFALGAMTGCHSFSRVSRLEPIEGHLDLPASGSKMRETGIVGGWAVAESGVKRVAVYIDKQFIRFIKPEEKRPDIAKIYGADFPESAEKSGWTFMLDVTKMADGVHEIVAQVETNKGGVREFGPIPFQVIH